MQSVVGTLMHRLISIYRNDACIFFAALLTRHPTRSLLRSIIGILRNCVFTDVGAQFCWVFGQIFVGRGLESRNGATRLVCSIALKSLPHAFTSWNVYGLQYIGLLLHLSIFTVLSCGGTQMLMANNCRWRIIWANQARWFDRARGGAYYAWYWLSGRTSSFTGHRSSWHQTWKYALLVCLFS